MSVFSQPRVSQDHNVQSASEQETTFDQYYPGNKRPSIGADHLDEVF